MATLTAADQPIIVDNTATPPETSGSTTIAFTKNDASDQIWQRTFRPGSSSTPAINWNQIAGPLGPNAFTDTFSSPALMPGDVHEVGIFPRGNSPLAPDPIRLASLLIVAAWKGPQAVPLISDRSGSTGGTWHSQGIATTVPTALALIAASRQPVTFDAAGLPRLIAPEGTPAKPLAVSAAMHQVELVGLLPGQHYFLAAVVVDDAGNWEALKPTVTFDTLKRSLTVQFPTIHIYNDGDPNAEGEAQFWFRVTRGGPVHTSGSTVIQEFHLPTMDIDDWNETDRPYPVGFAHVGLPESVEPNQVVRVASWATEDDGVWGDEGAGAPLGVELTFPVGRFAETVVNCPVHLDCRPSTTGDDFHYGVDILYSVAYSP